MDDGAWADVRGSKRTAMSATGLQSRLHSLSANFPRFWSIMLPWRLAQELKAAPVMLGHGKHSVRSLFRHRQAWGTEERCSVSVMRVLVTSDGW